MYHKCCFQADSKCSDTLTFRDLLHPQLQLTIMFPTHGDFAWPLEVVATLITQYKARESKGTTNAQNCNSLQMEHSMCWVLIEFWNSTQYMPENNVKWGVGGTLPAFPHHV